MSNISLLRSYLINKLDLIPLTKEHNIRQHLIAQSLRNRHSVHRHPVNSKLNRAEIDTHPHQLPPLCPYDPLDGLILQYYIALLIIFVRLVTKTMGRCPRLRYAVLQNRPIDNSNKKIIIFYVNIPNLKISASWVNIRRDGKGSREGYAVPIIHPFLEDSIARSEITVEHVVLWVELELQHQVAEDRVLGMAAITHYQQSYQIINQPNKIQKQYPIQNKQSTPHFLPLRIFGPFKQFIYMSDNPTQSSSTFPLPAQQNHSFITSMTKNRMQLDTINFKEIDHRINQIMHKMGELNSNQKNQWREIQESKIFNLSRSIQEKQSRGGYSQGSKETQRTKMKALKQHLRILVIICNKMKLEYDARGIMEVIKRLYFNQYGKEIFREFQKVGYSTHEFIVLTAVEESSFFGLCCCVEENSYF